MNDRNPDGVQRSTWTANAYYPQQSRPALPDGKPVTRLPPGTTLTIQQQVPFPGSNSCVPVHKSGTSLKRRKIVQTPPATAVTPTGNVLPGQRKR